MSWDSIAADHGTDKSSKGHDYMRHYEHWLRNLTVRNVLEIGVHEGRSLNAWAQIWPAADVWGIDINPDALRYVTDHTNVLIGDATSPFDTAALHARMWDVIVDDGSHQLGDIRATIAIFAHCLNPGGVYIIEDVDLGPDGAAPLHEVVRFAHSHGLRTLTAIGSSNRHHIAVVATPWP